MNVKFTIPLVIARCHTLLPCMALSFAFCGGVPSAALAATPCWHGSRCLYTTPAQIPVSGQGGDADMAGDGDAVEDTSGSAIHTTFADEMRWAKVHGMDDVDFRQEPPGLAFLYVLKSICKRYGYPFGSPYKVRVVSVKGEYPGDSLVPDYLRIYDGGEFSMDDYGEVIIRTDSAICEAFSYGRHAPYYDMGRRSQSISIGSRSRYPTGRPSMVICIMRKARPGARK